MTIKIQQCDRNAAAQAYEILSFGKPRSCRESEMLRSGNSDASPFCTLFAKHRIEAMTAAADICEGLSEVFGSEEYATGQPLSSLGERVACGQCSNAIRNAAHKGGKDE